ncbi:MAG: 50S ribosomal protein L11 methyltransferase [Cyclobacteriaceae bacterium]
MEYLAFKIHCIEAYREILMAEMSVIGFDSFLETDTGFEAHIEPEVLDRSAINKIFNKYQQASKLSLEEEVIPKINWNEEWEKHYDPISIGQEVHIRASFHPKQEIFRHEIIINPKMSFGTGHHATTHLMIQLQLTIDHVQKRVMDAGSGTGILAIMARKLGAKSIEAFDTDDWSVDNGNENFLLNGCGELKMKTGSINSIDPSGPFDIILANINKNVLLEEMNIYSQKLIQGGHLLLSGFYQTDNADIIAEAHQYGLYPIVQRSKNNWSVILLRRD